jgi:CubicO group peptidase (beta-lactamase class C family)
VRAPTLRELLCHRAGIFSQKRRITPAQRRLIRDFRLTLEQSVDGIAQHKLIVQPGGEYAYSGAGYCVIGRVAEVATGKPFECILQQKLAVPLSLKRTTYFPSTEDTNVAAGAVLDEERLRTNRQTPHLFGAELRLPLIGGSLYSTARETTRFARMIADRGRVDSKPVISNTTWEELTSQQADQLYGLGWSLALRDERTVQLSHNGSLASSRSKLRVDLDTGRSVVVHYTVAGSKDRRTGTAINKAVEDALNRDDESFLRGSPKH